MREVDLKNRQDGNLLKLKTLWRRVLSLRLSRLSLKSWSPVITIETLRLEVVDLLEGGTLCVKVCQIDL